MFWKRKDNDANAVKMPGPRDIPEMVRKQINPAQIDTGILPYLKMVTKNAEKGEKTYDFRIFDPAEAEARDFKVVNYSSLDGAAELIIAEGQYAELTKTVTLNMKQNMPKCKFLTESEILQQVESLKTPSDQVFFYAAAGGGAGGPLGRGAHVIKLNPVDAPKKRKKYGVYSTRVINMQPVFKAEGLVFDSDKPKDIAKWVSESHKPRFC